jgi:hypothetical protein
MIDLLCEFLAFWMCGTHRRELAGITGLQPRRLSTLLKSGPTRRGRKTFCYDRRLKRFVVQPPADAEELHALKLHGVKSPDEVIVTLLAVAAWSSNGAWHASGEAPFPCPVVSTSRYRRQPEPDVFRTLLGACARKKPVEIVYRARTREITTQFSPHTIVQTAQRIHFRGYSPFDSPEGHYWDLVPSRVMWAELSASGYVDGSGDAEWQEETKLQLVLSPDLPPPMRSAVRREHGMEGDHLTLGPLPKALMRYVLAEYTHRRYEGYSFEVWAQRF